MAISLVKSNKGTSALATTTASFGSATTAGNLIVLAFAADDYNGTPGAGWTQSTGMEQQTFHGGYLWWRISTGETNFSYTIGSASNSAWVIAEFSGVHATPFDISNGQFIQTSTFAYTTPSIIPTTGSRLLCAMMGGSIGGASLAGQTWGTWLNSFTGIDSSGSGGGGTNDIAGLAYRLVTGDGSTGFSSGATCSNILQSRSGLIIAFKEASGGGTAVTASSLSTTAPTIGAPALIRLSNAVASSLTTTSPTIGAPAVVGNVSLSAASLTTSATVVGAPALVRVVPFTASTLITSAPTIGAPALIRLSNAIASTLTTSSPTIGAPSLAPVYNLVGANFISTTLTLGAPAVVGNVSLSATSLTISAAIANNATFTPFHALLPAGLSLQLPLIGNTSLIGNVALTASVLTTSSPILAATTLIVVYNFIASNLSISSPSFTAPNLQAFALLNATGVSTSSPTVNSTALGVVVNLVAASVQTSSPTIGAPATIGNVALETSDLEIAAPEFEDLVLKQRHVLGASTLSTGPPQIFDVQLFLMGEVAPANIQTPEPIIGAPELVERVSHLDSESFETTAPSFGSAVFHQVHALHASVLETSAPTIGSTAFKQKHALTAVFDPLSIEIGAPGYNKIANFVASPIVRGATVVGIPTSNYIGNLTAANLNVGSITLGAPSLGVILSASSFTNDLPVLGAPGVTVYSPLAAAPFLRSPITFNPAVFDNGVRDLVATYVGPSPLLGSPLLYQQHALSSVVWAPPYAALPSPIATHRSTQEPLHFTRLVGIRSGVRATINGTRQTRRATVSGSRKVTSVNGVTQ